MPIALLDQGGCASVVIAALSVMLVLPDPAAAQPAHAVDKQAQAMIRIPGSIQAEHREVMESLNQATHASGRVGAAARELAKLLRPHFEREEEIALPPLGLLRPLAAGDRLADDASSAAVSMSESLRSELPRMMQEHEAIRRAVGKLREAARAEKAAKYERFAEKLAMHARSEEEVLYPAAIVVGDLIRAKRAATGSEPARK
jgi:hypothetical protein